jgi:hypothetical protein
VFNTTHLLYVQLNLVQLSQFYAKKIKARNGSPYIVYTPCYSECQHNVTIVLVGSITLWLTVCNQHCVATATTKFPVTQQNYKQKHC